MPSATDPPMTCTTEQHTGHQDQYPRRSAGKL
jgi:hypothetical protein